MSEDNSPTLMEGHFAVRLWLSICFPECKCTVEDRISVTEEFTAAFVWLKYIYVYLYIIRLRLKTYQSETEQRLTTTVSPRAGTMASWESCFWLLWKRTLLALWLCALVARGAEDDGTFSAEVKYRNTLAQHISVQIIVLLTNYWGNDFLCGSFVQNRWITDTSQKTCSYLWNKHGWK